MNKLAVVLGVAAVVTLAGCKDPQYQRGGSSSQDEVKNVETDVTPETGKVEEIKPVEIKETPKCKCAPGTKHAKPCECGAPDCQCIVEVKAVEPEYTVYIVQPGDYLAKISKKFNVTISSIKKLNNLKSDNVRLGQKLKLPGKVNVGEQKTPVAAVKKPATAKKAYESYKGETKEYVVKSGDSLGKIAYSNGMNIRQLKELNGLTSDSLKVGQKLKVATGAKTAVSKPVVDKPVTDKPVADKPVVDKPVVDKPVVDKPITDKPVTDTPVTDKPETDTPVVDKPVVETPAQSDGVVSYIVKEGDTLPRIAIDYEVPVARIRELNNLGEGDEVKPGQVLKIPAAQ